MPENINELASIASKDEQAREKLILAQEHTILKMASASCHHYVSKDEDEWSVALCAFSKAIDTYSQERGDFLPYAGVVIRHELTDYYRKKGKEPEGILSIEELSENAEGDGLAVEIPDPQGDFTQNTLKDEIVSVNEMLLEYGFRFFDLTECSPRQEKTREQCAVAIRTALGSQGILSELEAGHKMPIQALLKESGVSRKILERYRKYIIMAILILKNDYPLIAEYLKFVRKEGIE